MSSDSSRKYYSHSYQKPIITYSHSSPAHSRDSSIDSHTSYDSGSSRTGYYTTSSRSSMGRSGGSHLRVVDERSERKHRVPDNDKKYIKTISRGNVDVTQHGQARNSDAEPRASESTHSERYSSSSKKNREYYTKR